MKTRKTNEDRFGKLKGFSINKERNLGQEFQKYDLY